MTLEKQSMKIMMQNEQLEQLDAEKNRLFSIIAHDLRSPLDSIQGFLELLNVQGIDEAEKAEMQRDLVLLTRSTSEMLSNLLSWSKAQMNGTTVSLDSIHLSEMLEKTLHIQKAIASKKQINLAYKIDNDIYITVDRNMLELVIRNLLNNAIKFTDPGGTIKVTAGREGSDCIICIEDNGKGIEYEKQADIFSLKIQSTQGTNSEKGTGLGLVLCHDFVLLQDGKIWFDSTPGTGSRFYIALPIAVIHT